MEAELEQILISECVITYDGAPTHSVSIMEFACGVVAHETQYFAGPFPAALWRAALAEPIAAEPSGGPGPAPSPHRKLAAPSDLPVRVRSVTLGVGFVLLGTTATLLLS